MRGGASLKMKQEKVNKILDDIVHLNNQITGLEMLIKGKKEKVKEYFASTGKEQIKHPDVTAFVTTRTKVDYDISSIKKTLDKAIYRKFIKRTYRLNIKKFKQICSMMNIDYRKFAKAIVISEQIDEEALDKLYENGEITLKDLSGCYDAQVSKSVSFRFPNSKQTTFNVTE